MTESRRTGGPRGSRAATLAKRKRVVELQFQGLSVSQISERLGIGRSSVYDLIKMKASEREEV